MRSPLPFITTLQDGTKIQYIGHPKAVKLYTFHAVSRLMVSSCDDEIHLWQYQEYPDKNGLHIGQHLASLNKYQFISGWDDVNLTDDGRWLLIEDTEDTGNNNRTNFQIFYLGNLSTVDLDNPFYVNSGLDCGIISCCGYPEKDSFLFDGNFHGEEHCVRGPERILRLNPQLSPDSEGTSILEPAPNAYYDLFENGFDNPKKASHPNAEDSGIYFAREIGFCDEYKHQHLVQVE